MTFPTNIVDLVTGGAFGIDVVKIYSDKEDLLVTALTGFDGSDELAITEKPLGTGYLYTDAAVKLPVERSMDVMFSNPIFTPDQIAAAVISGDLDALTESWYNKKDRLYGFMNDRILVSVQTHMDVIEDCLVKSITPYYSADENWDAFLCNVVVRQLKLLDSEGGGLIDQVEEAVG